MVEKSCENCKNKSTREDFCTGYSNNCGKWESNETVSTWEMVKLLSENPKRKAISTDANGTVSMINGILKWADTLPFVLCLNCVGKSNTLVDTTWTIIEPQKELKKMSFAEAARLYFKIREVYPLSLQSGRTMIDIMETITDEEVDGLWTVEGVYE